MTYYARKTAGLCVRCGGVRGSDGTSIRCRSCHDHAQRTQRLVRARRKKAGLCVDCRSPRSRFSSAYCATHYVRAREAKWRQGKNRDWRETRRGRTPRDAMEVGG